MIRMLTTEEVDHLWPFMEGTAEQVNDTRTPEIRYQIILSSFERSQEMKLGTGVFGNFEDDELKLVIGVLPWRSEKHYSLRNVFGKSGKWSAVTELIEFAVNFMEENGYYTFYWGRPIEAGDREGDAIRTRLFLTKVPERYDVVIEAYKDMGRSAIVNSFGDPKTTAVFRASLRNEFRPYKATGPKLK